MTSPTPDSGPEIAPSALFLFDLLQWVRQGRIRVPQFQRGYVWRRSDILALFESVRSSYPIGTLLFWSDPSGKNTGGEPGRLGPFALPDAPAGALLVLDGQQRVTTLAGVLLIGAMKPIDGDDRDPGRWRVYFDAAEDRFTHLSEPAKAWQVPASALSDTGSMFAAIGELFKLAPSDLPSKPKAGQHTAPDLSGRVQSVARRLQSYRLPIVEFRTSDLNLAVESFTLLNKRGITIGPDEMFAALTHQRGFDISARVSRALASVEAEGFGEVDRLVVLRTFLVVADLDPYRTDWRRLGEDKQQRAEETLRPAMEAAEAGLVRAVGFLRDEGMGNTRLLPYGLQLVGLGAWLAVNPTPTAPVRRMLRRWLWLTSFSAWFGQGNPSRYTHLLTEMLALARRAAAGEVIETSFTQLPWSTPTIPFPRVFDFRSARARAWLCVMVRKGTVRPDGSVVAPAELAKLVQEHGPAALRRIVTGSTDLVSSPANRVFNVFDDRTQAQARRLLQQVSVAPSFWPAHFLEPSILDPANGEGTDAAVRVRQGRLIEVELSFLRELELVPYMGTAEAPIDTDGDPPIDGPAD